MIPGVESKKDWSEKKTEPLPDVDACHQALLEDEAAMDYLMNGRGFSREIIEKQKIGLVAKRYFRECGEVRAIVYPYLVNGNCVYVHYRTLPTMPVADSKVPKAFNSPTGWDAPLYNGGILLPGLKEIVMVEGEANTIAALDHGYENIVGVPGANFKKAEWITLLDQLGLEKIYICYDKDKVGQKAAQTLAARIGVERCYKIVLPDFMVPTDEGGTRPGKDLNEWFVHGDGTAAAFDKLKEEAVLFDVDGVAGTQDSVQELEDHITGNGVEPAYKPSWPSLAELIGFDAGDVVDIVAEEKVGKTTFGLNLIDDMVAQYGDDGVIICLEMMRFKLARKWVCKVAGIADNIPKNAQEAAALKEAFLKAIPYAKQVAANRDGDLYFCYPRYETTDDIYKLMRDCIRRYGVKWIMLDNLQRLADTTPRGKRNRTEHLSEISKITSQIAKDFGVVLVRIIQPHAIMKGQIATSRDADGASQIRKDCDCSISLHRNPAGGVKTVTEWDNMPYIKQETAFDDKLLVSPDLSRYSSGGQCTLHYDGARSRISEYNIAQIAKMQAAASQGVGYEAIKAAFMGPTQAVPAVPTQADPAPEITF